MTNEPTAPPCIVIGCEELSALSSTATGPFFSFATYFCANHYEKLLEGDDVPIDVSRVIVERAVQVSDAE